MNYDDQYDNDGIEGTQQTQPLTQTQRTASMPKVPAFWGTLTPIGGRQDLNLITFLNEKKVYRFGRHPQENDIILPGKKISNNHCKVIRAGDDDDGDSNSDLSKVIVFIEDTSSNGTFINGQRIGKGKRLKISAGDEVSLGNPLSNIAGSMDDYRYIFRPRPQNAFDIIDEKAGGGVFAKYEIGAQIGKGSFATVKKAYDRMTGTPRAIKQIAKHRFAMNAKTLKMFEREIGIIKVLDHENIARFCDIFEDDQVIYLVIEFAAGGDLLDYIINRGGLPEDESKDIARQMCEAMAYTHSKGITHRDLKPENILLCSKNNPTPQVKITDFGLAKAVDSQTHLKTMCGTPSYLAPEIVLKRAEGYDQAVDSWSAGVIIYAMLTNSSPFEEHEEEPLQERVLKRKVDYNILRKFNVSEIGIDFISKLLIEDPKTRLSLKDALSHPWLSDGLTKSNSEVMPSTKIIIEESQRSIDIRKQIEALQAELRVEQATSPRKQVVDFTTGQHLKSNFFQDSSSPLKSNNNYINSSSSPSNNKNNGKNNSHKNGDVSCSADLSQLQLQNISPVLKRKKPDDMVDDDVHNDYNNTSPHRYALRERKRNNIKF